VPTFALPRSVKRRMPLWCLMFANACATTRLTTKKTQQPANQEEDRTAELRDAGRRAGGLNHHGRIGFVRQHPSQPCAEIDRPPWHPGSPPQRTTPITLPAAPTATSRLPLRTIGAALTQIPCRHGHSSHSPHQMPDIRLQAQPFVRHPDRSIAGVGGGVHIRGVRSRAAHLMPGT
jgi:hypothetical protein